MNFAFRSALAASQLGAPTGWMPWSAYGSSRTVRPGAPNRPGLEVERTCSGHARSFRYSQSRHQHSWMRGAAISVVGERMTAFSRPQIRNSVANGLIRCRTETACHPCQNDLKSLTRPSSRFLHLSLHLSDPLSSRAVDRVVSQRAMNFSPRRRGSSPLRLSPSKALNRIGLQFNEECSGYVQLPYRC
jgi:hypothetical protein